MNAFVHNAAKIWVDAQVERAKNSQHFAEPVLITPAIARELLSRNDENRSVNASSVKKISASIREGAWETNGEPIIVSSCGRLNDGQHRLLAIIETGASIISFIVFGVSRKSRSTVDGGVKRTPGHVLHMNGVKSADTIAASIKIIMNYEAGAYLTTPRQAPAILEYYENNTGFDEALRLGALTYTSVGWSPSFLTAAAYLYGKKRPEQVTTFFESLASGIGLSANSPIYLFRERLIKDGKSKAKLPNIEIMALLLKALNAFSMNKTIKTLRWSEGGNEAFPEII